MIEYLIIYAGLWVFTGFIVTIRLDNVKGVDSENMGFWDIVATATVLGLLWPIFWLLYVFVKVRSFIK